MGKKKGKKGSKESEETQASGSSTRPGASTQQQGQNAPPQQAGSSSKATVQPVAPTQKQDQGAPRDQTEQRQGAKQQKDRQRPESIPPSHFTQQQMPFPTQQIPSQQQIPPPQLGPRPQVWGQRPPGMRPPFNPQGQPQQPMMQHPQPRMQHPQPRMQHPQPMMQQQQPGMQQQQQQQRPQMMPQQPELQPQTQVETPNQDRKGKRGPKQKQQQQKPHEMQQPQPTPQQLPQSTPQQHPQPTPQQHPQPTPQQQPQPAQTPQQKQTKQQQKQPGRPSQPSGGQASSSREPPTKELERLKVGEQLEIKSKSKVVPGRVGRRIPIEVNHLKLNLGKLRSAIHYDVNIIPDVPKRCLRPVMEKFREVHYPKNYPAFDGRKNLYSTKLLPFGESIADSVTIMVEDRSKEYKVEIKYANTVDLTPLHDLMQSIETPREALQVIDIVLRMPPASRCIPAGRSFFLKPQTIIDLGEGMEMYNGFYQSTIRGWQPFLNVDVAHKAFPKSVTVLQTLKELLDSRFAQFGDRELERPLDARQKDTFQKFMRQLRVVYQIPGNPSSKRIFRVNGIRDSARDKTFKLDDGRQMTIEQYFATEKRCKLRYPLLPTLWVGSLQREILIPVEFCTIVEGQAVNRKMTENQTSAMIKRAATSTDERKKKIYRALDETNHNIHPSVREFGFSVANEFEKLDARVLPPPALKYSSDRTVPVSKGVWRGDRFYIGKEIKKWTIAVADRRLPRPEELSNFANMIYRNGAQSGMLISSEATKPYTAMGNTMHDFIKYFQTAKQYGYDIIFVVVPNQGVQYANAKKAAELNVGCLTQCIKMRTLGRMNPQIVGNILLKVNSKLNGTNHFLAQRPPIMNKPCMIMGADVTHPSPDSQGIPSVAAVTASHDPKAFCYNICWRLQPPKTEIIEDLESITREQLLFFHSKTKIKPERIVFFRDGVSEGQFDQVRDAEIMAIRRACKSLQSSGYEPAITFLVVQKRHHTRMFPMNPRDSEDRNNNVPAGTCVDSHITHPFMQDFYLVSHASIQGVAKPTKYCTLWDDNEMSNDEIEQLTYFLCHMFTRCNRSVSYPAPTYYAHLAAARAKVYIENERLNMNDLNRECQNFKILDSIRKDMPMFFV